MLNYFCSFNIYFILIVIINPVSGIAQKQTDHWIFGKNYHFEVSKDSFKRLPNSAIDALEGSSSISDAEGNLLFYTDGITVWDRDDNVMPNGNGLYANPISHSNQAALILAAPGSPGLFYVFSNDSYNGLFYSLVDMSQNAGKGMVTLKNRRLSYAVTEGLTACNHRNNRDAWIIAHESDNNTFLAFLLNENGIQLPIASKVGYVHSGSSKHVSCIKASSDSKKMACTAFIPGMAEVYEFNDSCGTLCNPIQLIGNNYQQLYGSAFSASGNMVYFTQGFLSPVNIWQFDLTLPKNEIAKNGEITAVSGDNSGSMQLGADGSIYIASSSHVGRIQYPELPGVQCKFNSTYWPLNANSYYQGLPNFNQSLFRNDSLYLVKHIDVCQCKPERMKIIIPNVITPNSDNINDELTFKQYDLEEYKFEVYNRWGQMVFNSSNPAEPFTGTVNGKQLVSGTYYCVLTYKLSYEKEISLVKSTVTILND